VRRERRGLVRAGWARGHPHTHTSGLAGIFSSGPRFSSKYEKRALFHFLEKSNCKHRAVPAEREPAVAALLCI